MSKALLELFLTFLKIGFIMFGGGYAMIPILRYEVVLKHQWISEQEFVDVIAVAESTPGPIALNSATYVGYKVAGVAGAVLASLGIVLPAFILMLAIAIMFTKFYAHYIIRGVLNGIRGAVVGLILSAIIVLVKSITKDANQVTIIITFLIAIAVFICTFFLELDPAVMIGLSALIGLTLALLKIW